MITPDESVFEPGETCDPAEAESRLALAEAMERVLGEDEQNALTRARAAFYEEFMSWGKADHRDAAVVSLAARAGAEQLAREAAAARARAAARAPREGRQHPARARAVEIAAEITGRRSGIKAARLADLVADQLATEGVEPPSPRTIRDWLQISGM